MGQTAGFKVRVGVVVFHGERLLLVRQNDRPFWVFPGGTLEPGETLAQCAVRELQEELALTTTLETLLYVADFLHPAKQTVDVFFAGRCESPELVMTEAENLNEAGWFDQRAVQAMDIRPEVVKSAVLAHWPEAGLDTAAVGPYLGAYTASP